MTCTNNRCFDTRRTARKVYRGRRGITLLEVVFAMYIFLMMAMMFTMVTTAVTRSSRYGNSYAQAMNLAQRKIDQLKNAGFNAVKASTSLPGMGITDDNGAASSGFPTAKGSNMIYHFTNIDNLSKFFYVGTGSDTASGTITVTPYPDTGYPDANTGHSTPTMLKATIKIQWQDQKRAQSYYQTETVITSITSQI